MNLKNRVQLIGHLGNDPEVKELESGKKLAKFSLATNETYYDQKGNKTTDTEWHNIIAWGKQAELASKLLAKGKEVILEGKLTNRSWEDNEGNKRYITEIIMNEFALVGGKQ